MKDIIEKIKGYAESKSRVEITTRYGTETTNGYILKYNQSFILMQVFNDFDFIGYVILPVNQIKKIKNRAFFNEIFSKEALEIKQNDTDIDFDNWHDLLKYLKAKKSYITVLREQNKMSKDERDYYCLGAILDLNKDHLNMLYFNAECEWDTKPTEIKYKDITSIMLDANYINTLSEYLEERPQLKSIDEQLNAVMSKKQLCMIERNRIDKDSMLCYPIARSEKYLLVSIYNQFLFSGYRIMRIQDITFVKEEPFHTKMYMEMNLIRDTCEEINIDNLYDIFTHFKDLDKNIIIENESLNRDYPLFFIGKITKINNHSLRILEFDVDGYWWEHETSIKFDSITIIRFNEKYIDTLSKYLKYRKE